MSSLPPLWPDEPDAESASIADDAAAFAVYGLAKRLRGVAGASPLEDFDAGHQLGAVWCHGWRVVYSVARA